MLFTSTTAFAIESFFFAAIFTQVVNAVEAAWAIDLLATVTNMHASIIAKAFAAYIK